MILLDAREFVHYDAHQCVGQSCRPPQTDQETAVTQDLRVEYISIMAQAQKLAGIASIERFAGFGQGLLQVNPEAADKIDFDQMIDVYADRLSLQPGIVRPDEQVAAMRKGRADAQAKAQAVQDIQMGAAAAKDLGTVNMEEDNGMTRLLQNANAGSLVRQ